MADIVLGLASSHSPQLSTPSEGWRDRGERDKGNQELIGNDGIVCPTTRTCWPAPM